MKNLNPKLAMYSSMAMATLSLIGAANAQVVYTDVDPDLDVYLADDYFSFDMNDDGIADFGMGYSSNPGYKGYCSTDRYWTLYPLVSHEVAFNLKDVYAVEGWDSYYLGEHNEVKSFKKGTLIDSAQQFTTYSAFTYYDRMYFCSTYEATFGKFGTAPEYAGIKLMIDGQPHYGWLLISKSKLFAYAYQGLPNMPITAGSNYDCAFIPALIDAIVLPTAVKLFFEEIPESAKIKIIYSEVGTDVQTVKVFDKSSFKLDGLNCDTQYKYMIAVLCEDGDLFSSTGYSEVMYFTTGSCRMAAPEQEVNVLISPNPVQNIATLLITDPVKVIEVTALTGELIMRYESQINNTFQMNFSNVPNGIYIVRVYGDDSIAEQKVIIQK